MALKKFKNEELDKISNYPIPINLRKHIQKHI